MPLNLIFQQPVRLRREEWDRYAAYIFCLLVSYYGVQKARDLQPERLFEEMATLAAERFLGGEAEHFGFPRKKLPRTFAKAVDAICLKIHEGKGFYGSQSLDSKDSAVDVIAWRPFKDGLPGQLILFGQCAAGEDWYKKRSELNPDAFCKKWMERQPVSPVIKAFFTPRRVDSARWDNLGYDAGIVFDRCRIAYYAHRGDQYSRHLQWSKAVLRKI